MFYSNGFKFFKYPQDSSKYITVKIQKNLWHALFKFYHLQMQGILQKNGRIKIISIAILEIKYKILKTVNRTLYTNCYIGIFIPTQSVFRYQHLYLLNPPPTPIFLYPFLLCNLNSRS